MFARHTEGVVSGSRSSTDLPPPVGLLAIAAYIRARRPDAQVEVLDGNRVSDDWLVDRIRAPVVGFSVWFSNYAATLALIRRVKARHPRTRVVLGGPHATALGGCILKNQRGLVDAVVAGDGEEAMLALMSGAVSGGLVAGEPLRLDDLPLFDLEPLVTPYAWSTGPFTGQAFPIASIRGCFRKRRCEYCAIPTSLIRTLSPERAWGQIRLLRERYGIDFFFETGDTFLPGYARQLAASPERQSVRFRVYGYPGLLKRGVAELYAALGVTHMFIGIESVLIWKSHFKRTYSRNFSANEVIREIQLAGEYGIQVMPSFIFGLPGETKQTLADNLALFRDVARLENVKEMHLNPPVPLPGTDYFRACLDNPGIQSGYRRRGLGNLADSDQIDYAALCREFIDANTQAGSEAVFSAIMELLREYSGRVSHWCVADPAEAGRQQPIAGLACGPEPRPTSRASKGT